MDKFFEYFLKILFSEEFTCAEANGFFARGSCAASCAASYDSQPNGHLLVQSKEWKHQSNVWNLFKLKNENTRTMPIMSLWCLYCQLWTDFRHCSDISIIDFEELNTGCEWGGVLIFIS